MHGSQRSGVCGPIAMAWGPFPPSRRIPGPREISYGGGGGFPGPEPTRDAHQNDERRTFGRTVGDGRAITREACVSHDRYAFLAGEGNGTPHMGAKNVYK